VLEDRHVGHAAAALLIIAEPLVVLATVLIPPVAMARRTAHPLAAASWSVALALVVVWGVTTYRASVSAEETGAGSDLLGTVAWLALALAAALASLLVTLRVGSGRRSHRTT
jgi:hypothetical protein